MEPLSGLEMAKVLSVVLKEEVRYFSIPMDMISERLAKYSEEVCLAFLSSCLMHRNWDAIRFLVHYKAT